MEDPVPNQPALHHTPTHRTSLQKGPPLCLRRAHDTHCGTSTAIFSRQTGLAATATLPPSTVWAGCAAHTHCLTPTLITGHSRERQTSGQQRPTIAVHNGGSGSPATTKWSLSLLQKTPGITDSCVLMDIMVQSLSVISASFSPASACMDVHSNNFLEVPRRRGILHV